MWWDGASTTGKDTVNAKALAETLETMLWSLTTMSKVMMNIKSDATSKMMKQMIDSDNQFATIGELEEIMRQIRIELENWDEDVIDLKKIKKIRKTDITEKAKHVADLFAYHLFEWRVTQLFHACHCHDARPDYMLCLVRPWFFTTTRRKLSVIRCTMPIKIWWLSFSIHHILLTIAVNRINTYL